MPDWKINIDTVPGGAAFVPAVAGAKPGDPLNAMQDDLVTWANNTGQTHQPWPATSSWAPLPDDQVPRTSPLYLSDPIDAGGSSRPTYDVSQPAPVPPATTGPTQWTVYYVCKIHPSEHGTIVGNTY
jgi:hypothetical protein